jgi:hypothetical protein
MVLPGPVPEFITQVELPKPEVEQADDHHHHLSHLETHQCGAVL